MQKNLILGYGQTGKSFEIFLNQKRLSSTYLMKTASPGTNREKVMQLLFPRMKS